ncbi:DnaA N-terminal domain-containing protein, partial [Aquidulcibacter sp.]|uniref:DnaA N-terminal domain-containing protein n=1 Tax=Aquidulcibacter sp. TaxID=2052990 RepID=UPI00345C250C
MTFCPVLDLSQRITPNGERGSVSGVAGIRTGGLSGRVNCGVVREMVYGVHTSVSATPGLANLSSDLELSAARGLWATALPRLRGELGPDAFRAWIEPLRLMAIDAASVTFGAPNGYAV